MKDIVSLERMLEKLYEWVITRGVNMFFGVIFLSIGWKVINKTLKRIRRILESKNADPTITRFLDNVMNVTLKTVLIIIILQYIGVNLTGLTTIVASAGVALSLALKGSLANLAGGVIILVARPFNVGDFIETTEHSGVVEKISIFYTYLVTFDNKQILIPNGILTDSSIVNYSSKEIRRVDLTFSVSYEEDVIRVKNVLINILKNNELVLEEPEFFVGISMHGDSAINFIVKAWCKTEDYWTVYYDLLETVKIKFDEEGISIPYPQMDLHVKKNIIID
ncbi:MULTISPECIES: mechanosensitive ion channel family protein [Clostridia]|uniref:Mechanosensitive ion channel n=2 Tax=Clostridia TaxID=186801 RepID=A0A8I0A3T8_9CLOT|nr:MULTISPECIES: mechanosensitive ion channel domain-containing protein [Clostridia]MBC5638894.1 mechanosensitive ion channel [Clostridium lentum]MBC5652987.1 mechanosensitive ion channel [Blautia lenta]OKZ87533.1 MAG: mechanosensitive ion channel protein MscS [Clostridium sp. 29_15]